jgi:pyridoxamine 5'-phosphate oxidase-like protein
MGKVYGEIDERLRAFIERQKMFFVATAPAGDGGRVNVSPKGRDTLRVLGPREVAYLDHVGSGAETIAHVRQNGRITIMLCAFEGPPSIVRLYGRGEILEPQDEGFADLRAAFPPWPRGRTIVRIGVERIADSCGYGVPLFRYEGEREQLDAWAERKGEDFILAYQREKNAVSIDGLPALRWARPDRDGER